MVEVLKTFFNSGFFVGLATIITGVVVLLVYFQQKRDMKVQAARVLLTEIRTAEERINQIKEAVQRGLTNDLPSVFTTKSWQTYSHLFVSDFDQDELKLIGLFYDCGELIEDFAKRNNSFFWVTTEERARVSTQKVAEIILKASEMAITEDQKNEYISTSRAFLSSKLDSYNVMYVPAKTMDEIKAYLNKVQMITTSSCGVKLKKFAKVD